MAETYEAVFEAARQSFRESGLAGLDPDVLAERHGFEAAAVRAHFPDRETLHFALAEAALSAVGEQARQTMPAQGLADRIKHLFAARIDFYNDNRVDVRPLIEDVIFGENEWRTRYENLLWRTSVQLVSLIQEAKRQGEVKPDTDETVAGRALVSYFMTTAIMILRDPSFDNQAARGFVFPMVDALVASLRC